MRPPSRPVTRRTPAADNDCRRGDQSGPERPRNRDYFIDLYLKHYVPSHYELKIVPTYRCDLSCSYCYARAFRSRHSGEMSWPTFRGLVDAFIAEGGKSVRFLGGEPALWEHIDRAVAYLRERSLRTFVLTGGTVALGELPDEIHLNVEYYWQGRPPCRPLEGRLLRVLESYRDRGGLVRFRYNIQPSDPAGKVEDILALAAEYGVPSIHLGTVWPHEKTRRFGREIVDIVRRIRARGLGCTLGDPMPFCLFTDEERDELRETANLSGRCMCGHIPLVNPDGETVFPCQAVGVPRPMSDLAASSGQRRGPDLVALRNVWRAFRHDVGCVVRAVDEQCLSCRHFLAGECQGGCLGDRVGLLSRAAEAGGLDRVVRGDVFTAATAAEIPTSFRRADGWISWPEGGAHLSCQVRRGVQEFHRGDWIVAARAGEGRLSLGVLLGLPGEILALTPEGELYVQDLVAPAGARLLSEGGDGGARSAGSPFPGLVEETALFDLGELEVLVAPALPDDGAPLKTAGPISRLPLGSLAGRVTKLAGEAPGGPVRRSAFRRAELPRAPEVRGLRLVAGPNGRHSGRHNDRHSDRHNGRHNSRHGGELGAEFDLAASKGTIVEIEVVHAGSHKQLSRGLAFQPRDGLVRHAVRLERTETRLRRVVGTTPSFDVLNDPEALDGSTRLRRRGGRCLLSVHLAGRLLASCTGEIT